MLEKLLNRIKKYAQKAFPDWPVEIVDDYDPFGFKNWSDASLDRYIQSNGEALPDWMQFAENLAKLHRGI